MKSDLPLDRDSLWILCTAPKESPSPAKADPSPPKTTTRAANMMLDIIKDAEAEAQPVRSRLRIARIVLTKTAADRTQRIRSL